MEGPKEPAHVPSQQVLGQGRGEELAVGAVVLITDGFRQSAELVKHHLPDGEGDEIWSSSAETSSPVARN
jgi:hypothetical protein